MDNNEKKLNEKIEWVRPEFQRLEAGAAESQDGATADGGGGLQGS
ncbi:MAG: hypothetical protein ACK40O_11825 [Allosphingosinicella sp.]